MSEANREKARTIVREWLLGLEKIEYGNIVSDLTSRFTQALDAAVPQDDHCYAEGDEGAKYCGAPRSTHCSVLGKAITHEHLVKCMRDDHLIHHRFIGIPQDDPVKAANPCPVPSVESQATQGLSATRCPKCTHKGWLGDGTGVCRYPTLGLLEEKVCGCKCVFPAPPVSQDEPLESEIAERIVDKVSDGDAPFCHCDSAFCECWRTWAIAETSKLIKLLRPRVATAPPVVDRSFTTLAEEMIAAIHHCQHHEAVEIISSEFARVALKGSTAPAKEGDKNHGDD